MTTDAPSWSTRVRRATGSIRVRVVLGSVGLLVVGLAITLLLTREVLHARLDRQVEQDLAQEVEELRQLAGGTDPETGAPFADDVEAIFTTFLSRNIPADDEFFFTLVAGDPHLYSPDPPAPLLDDPDLVAAWATAPTTVRRDVETSAGPARTLAAPLQSDGEVRGTFVVAIFPAQAHREIDDAMLVLAGASLLVTAVAAAAAWSLAGRIVRPVRELTATARQVSDSDLTARIPVDGHDELAELGLTFNDMLARLEHGVTAQRRFLDDVAHELRTPITIVRGHLEVAGDDPAEVAEVHALVTDELDRMGRYVDDLLLLAKAEQPDLLRLAPVDLGELATTLVARVRSLGDRSWLLDEAPAPGRAAALADAGRLEQAVLNLAANAVQHTEAGDEIALGVVVDGDRYRLWVRDRGPGLPADLRDRLFDRTTRGAASRAVRPDGTGIGLSIVLAIADAHGGSVTADDAPGGGARFTLDLPLDPEEHP